MAGKEEEAPTSPHCPCSHQHKVQSCTPNTAPVKGILAKGREQHCHACSPSATQPISQPATPLQGFSSLPQPHRGCMPAVGQHGLLPLCCLFLPTAGDAAEVRRV